MILRLQSEQELELLQSRIKAKLPSRIHLSPLRNDTGTDPRLAPSIAESHHFPPGTDPMDELLPPRQDAKTPVKTPKKRLRAVQNGPRSTFEHQLLGRQLTQAGIAFREEFRFEPKRRWRFDFLVDNFGIEIDGGLWIRGRHSGGQGQIDDMEKGNHAILLGYRILKFTPDQVKSGEAVGFIEQATKKAAL